MPIRIRWARKEFLGLSFIIFGAVGLFQVLFIAHGQYLSDVGSIYAIVLVPIGVSLALTFSTMILYEALAQRARSARIRRSHGKGKFAEAKTPFWKTRTFYSLVAVAILFSLFYIVGFAIAAEYLEAMQSFVIGENVGAIGTLVIVSVFETQYAPKIRTY